MYPIVVNNGHISACGVPDLRVQGHRERVEPTDLVPLHKIRNKTFNSGGPAECSGSYSQFACCGFDNSLNLLEHIFF